MLIAHGILPDLISQLSSYSFFGMAPLFWDQADGQFKVKKSAVTCIASVVTLQLGLCLLVHDWYIRQSSSTHSSSNGGDSGGVLGEKAFHRFQRLSCAFVLFLVGFVHAKNMRSAHTLIGLLNGLVAFEQKYTGRIKVSMDWKGKVTKYLCLAVRLCTNLAPLLITVLITLSETSIPLNLIEFLEAAPSSTFLPGSVGDLIGGTDQGPNKDLDLSSPSMSGNVLVQRFITWTITAAINLAIWHLVVSIRSFWTCGQILVGCYGIRSALNLYANIMTRGKLLRITKEKMQEALIYREIQLLSGFFNEVHGNPIFTIFLLLASVLQSVSLYLYVRCYSGTTTNPFYILPSSLTWISRTMFIAYMLFDGIFIVFVVFASCAEVYLRSVQVKEQLQQNEVFQRSEWFNHYFLSCAAIKLRAGSTNFISEGQLGFESSLQSQQQNESNESPNTPGSSKRNTVSPSPSESMFGGNGIETWSTNSEENLSGILSTKMANLVNNNGNGFCGCGNGNKSPAVNGFSSLVGHCETSKEN